MIHVSSYAPQLNMTGKIVPVPKELKPYLVSWADAECSAYEFGTIIRQTLATEEYSIYVSVFNIHTPITLQPHLYTPSLSLQYVRQGNFMLRLNEGAEIELDTSRYSLLHIAAGRHIIRLQPGISVGLRIEVVPAYLQELLNAHPPLEKMLAHLHNNNQTAPLLSAAIMNGKVKNILHYICACNKTGASLQLEMKAHIFELLSAFDENITQLYNISGMEATQTAKRIMAIKHHIMQYPHIHECSLGNLAKQFNLSTSLMKAAFKKQYSIALSDFVQQQCIQKAQQLLAQDTDTVRNIAAQLGYTDVSNFCRAFKNYVGCTPNDLRRQPERFKNV